MQNPATRVDFYVLETADEAARLRFACRLIEKAYKLQHRIYAHTGSAQQSKQLDDLLWSFRDLSFVPHGVQGEKDAAEAPVVIGHEMPDNGKTDVLINLADEAPAGYDRFKRVIEVIDASETGRNAGRARFGQYRNSGLEPETHKIN